MERFRIGLGYDSHRFAEGRPLKLGGITIPGESGLLGHSDADVLLHAIIDALLGAAALGDIGSHFPDDDPAWLDADSGELLVRTRKEVEAAGWTIGNIDATVICEQPKLRPYVDAMRKRIAELLGCPMDSISIKGKTNEGMDAIGQGAGIAVHCVVLVVDRG
jgi:2-C-methyl-D-erythritol 2,4-cyclodiphosphate synthase